MSPEKDAALVRDFPHLFRDRNASMTQTGMCWGFQCLDGWEPLIREACSKIEPIIVKMINNAIKTDNLEELDCIPAASCLKEKFGTLSWYLTSGTDEIYKILDEAEKKSAKTCEQCGSKGKLRGTGWVYTLCAKCWKKHKAERGK